MKKSNCCHALVTVVGNTTMHYVCSKCKEACDLYIPEDKKEQEIKHIKEDIKQIKGRKAFAKSKCNKYCEDCDREIESRKNRIINLRNK